MFKAALLACASFLLFGCSSTHLPEPNATVNVEAITYAILTELYCAAIELPGNGNDHAPYFASNDNWVGLIDLSLSASVEASANPSVSLLGPFNPFRAVAPNGGTTGTFASVFSSSIDETRTNLRDYKMYIKMVPLIQNWPRFAAANAWPVDCLHPNAGGTFLQGHLGLKSWLAPAVRVQEAVIDFEVLNPPAGPGVPPPPSITDIFPRSGREGTTVNITGTNLPTKNFQVFFGTKTATVVLPGPNAPNTGGTLITVKAPQQDANTPPVAVVVQTKAGTTATAPASFTYTNGNEFSAQVLAGSGGGASSGSSQSPTISGTFTFQIKTTGTIGPSFTLTRVSGGASNLFTAARTDNNFANIILTPATYCPVGPSAVLATVPECAPNKAVAGVIPNTDLQSATQRLENALLNLNLNHLVQQP